MREGNIAHRSTKKSLYNRTQIVFHLTYYICAISDEVETPPAVMQKAL